MAVVQVICSRMRYMSSQLPNPVRLVGFSHRCVAVLQICITVIVLQLHCM